MDDLSYLAALSPLDFEIERTRLLAEHIQLLPEDKRKKAFALQLEIDTNRITHPDDHLAWLMTQIGERIEDLFDQWQHALTAATGNQPKIKPAKDR